MKNSLVYGVWKKVPSAIWRATWMERNRWIFEDKAMCFQNFKLCSLRVLYIWYIILSGDRHLNFIDFVDRFYYGLV